jgi:hypothetical protein
VSLDAIQWPSARNTIEPALVTVTYRMIGLASARPFIANALCPAHIDNYYEEKLVHPPQGLGHDRQSEPCVLKKAIVRWDTVIGGRSTAFGMFTTGLHFR